MGHLGLAQRSGVKLALKTPALVITSLLLASCGSDTAPPEAIRILGKPPGTAYLGVEYTYEFGVDGGDGLVDFSMTNQPRWLALEYVDNTFRKGIIMRGIPGVNGGGTAEDALTPGEAQEVSLTVSDGSSVGETRFSIFVDTNTYESESLTVAENDIGERPSKLIDANNNGREDEGEEKEVIPLCFTDAEGTPLFSEEDIAFFEERQHDDSLAVRPKLHYLPVFLEQPSVQRVILRYSLTSGSGDGATPGSDFLVETARKDGQVISVADGFLTYDPGVRYCHIPVFINDDRDAEKTENIAVSITHYEGGLLEFADPVNTTISITDNEPVASFKVSKASVSEGNYLNVEVSLDKAPEQTVYAEFVVDGDNSDGDFEGANADLRLYTGDGGVGSLITDGVSVPFEVGETSKTVKLQATANGDATLRDEKVTFNWRRSGTVNPGEEPLAVYINQWLNAVELPLNSGASVAEAISGSQSELFLARVNGDAGGKPANSDIMIYDRFGVLHQSIKLEAATYAVRIKDIWLYEKINPANADEITQDIYALLEVGGLFAPPVEPLQESDLGGKDVVVQKYQRINNVGAFELQWAKQIGSVWDDEPGALSVDLSQEVLVVGATSGLVGEGENSGRRDAMLIKFDKNGALMFAKTFGSSGDDVLLGASPESSSNHNVVGFSDGAVEDNGSSLGGYDAVIVSYNDDGDPRRVAQIGSSFNDAALDVSTVSKGFVSAGYTNGVLVSGESNRGGQDGYLAYHQNASEITAYAQIGGAAADSVLDVKSLGNEVYVSGVTAGDIFDAGAAQGGEDGWLARYDVVKEEVLDEGEEPGEGEQVNKLKNIWRFQRGAAANEKLSNLATFGSAKLISVEEAQTDSGVTVTLKPLSVVDGVDLNAACRADPNEDC
ncbi:hypothetical protein EUZ85_11765 [Hahella sp. KA22]|uniref:hypothetical protein n=1 Tax=Hahella sp. KA22 TaxID=1628392 RepID=UPI000FDDD92D|nr:hypothetical protein [Hahella sp. KA22]AZZ91372.1 hypothetical protein ENC22_09205 [Hahella sp. KA22]QAY54742.1 hypothetical protein EUZ85_11765 [Hahella sp. KA22]